MKNYKRVLIKLSGEALAGKKGFGYDYDFLNDIVDELITLRKSGVELALVVGGGNFWRGRQGGEMNRTTADQMGMLATVINGLALLDAFEQKDVKASLQSAIAMEKVCETFTRRTAKAHLENGEILIFAGGTGSPYFSTDTAAALRAAEIEADVILMAKNIDGIYNADPKKDPTATRYEELTYKQMIDQNLKALDLSAATFCMENDIRGYAFELKDPMNIYRVIMGEKIGTEIHC